MDRRNQGRCPICQGPAIADEKAPEGVRCRSSICKHNHQHVKCPRCNHQDLEGVLYDKGQFEYTCRECTHHWKV